MGFIKIDDVSGITSKNRAISILLGYEYRRAPRGPQDRDHDGVFDDRDTCPDEAEDLNDFEDDDGCPDGLKDDDADGVPDFQDQCRGEAEDVDGFDDQDGCPDPDDPTPAHESGESPAEGAPDSAEDPSTDILEKPGESGARSPRGTPRARKPGASLYPLPTCTRLSALPRPMKPGPPG